MLREQIINFLEASVIFLLVTNALSVMAATYAIRLLNAVTDVGGEAGFIERKLNAMLRGSPTSP